MCVTWNFVTSQQTFLVFQDVFSVTLFVFQDLLKTSSRRLQDVFAIRLPKMSSKRLPRRLQDVFPRRLAIMSSRRLLDVLEDKKMLQWRRLQYVFTKTNVCWVTHPGIYTRWTYFKSGFSSLRIVQLHEKYLNSSEEYERRKLKSISTF